MLQRSYGTMGKLSNKPLLIKVAFIALFFSTLVGVVVEAPKAHAINEPIDTNNPRITGLWNTGINASGQLLNMPAPNNASQSQPNYNPVNNSAAAEIRDPHWRLTDIDFPANGNPSCQIENARQAMTILPPWAAPGDNWVWWRGTIPTFATGNARWIGVHSDSYHESTPQCTDISNPSDVNSWPTWNYELVGGFNVGACVVPNSVQLNPRWAADDEFEMLVNGNTVIPRSRGGGNLTSTVLAPGVFRLGNNSLTIKVRSSYPLQGFVISWDPPTITCNQAKPYLKVFGNDVAAGGKFVNNTDCTLANLPNNRASILTFHRRQLVAGSPPTENWMGASTQLGAFALGQIQGFFSGGTQSPRRANVPSSPVNGLTFGNYGDPTIASSGADTSWDTAGTILDQNKVIADGGKGGQFRCITDYYQLVSNKIGGAPSTANSTPATSTGYFNPNSSALTINGGTVSGKHAIVVDGDVFISGNINYANYNSAATVPSLYVIARGNIYIDNDVRNLSGVFIAQPESNGSKGVIYTCATNGDGPVVASGLKANCNQSLTITGAFIANQVKFLRTNGDIAASTANELWNINGAGNIAEVFKSSAELYLSAPSQLQKSGSSKSNYNSITSLPPIL